MKKIIICVVAIIFAFTSIALAELKKPLAHAVYTHHNSTTEKETVTFTKREMTLLISPEEHSYSLRLQQFFLKDADRFSVWKKEITNKKK